MVMQSIDLLLFPYDKRTNSIMISITDSTQSLYAWLEVIEPLIVYMIFDIQNV